ncbi:M10 family metallopeptidase [Ramlibacter albus]|uniref:M10 family metallopeptidase C-terminal domain-containing protein n=1 Tax=Ramlibacter albus TaxID=2079448 RepID=A0A923M691_9BURK|nr:M10 family metallopeptidase [Ramlibacter albus]MBC5764730.1 M10 family metallopeptidase C-terminal domain-containing protein [Ramlibacter albus]
MATPTTGTDAVSVPLTGNTAVDSLLYGNKWASPVLTYSFPNTSSQWSTNSVTGYPVSFSSEPYSPFFTAFGAAAQVAARSALQKWANVARLTLAETADSGNNVGDIRFAFTDVGNAQAHAYSPGVAIGGDVWFSYSERNRSFAEGSYDYMTLVHETGHALGLKHNFSGVSGNGTVLTGALDNQSYTIMSYAALAGDQDTDFTYRPTTPMRLDIQAMQYLYGANTDYNAGNTAYIYAQNADYHQTIWDGGGIDGISYSGLDNAVIDLRAGSGSMLGNAVYVINSFGTRLQQVSNVWIADNVTIENGTGGGGNDRLTGNAVANKLDAGAGNDTLTGAGGYDRIEGGTGTDTAVFSGAASDYLVLFNAATGRYSVGDRLGLPRDAVDVVSGVEQFQFSDGARAVGSLTLGTAVTGNARTVLGVSEAFYGFGPGTSQYSSSLATVTSQGASAFAIGVGQAFMGVAAATLAQDVLTRLAVETNTLGGPDPAASYAAIRDALATIFSVYSDARGQVVLNLINLLAGLETDTVYGQAAATVTNRLTMDYNNLGPIALVGTAAEPGA